MLPPKEFIAWMERLGEAHRNSWQGRHEEHLAAVARKTGCARRMGLATSDTCLCGRYGCEGLPPCTRTIHQGHPLMLYTVTAQDKDGNVLWTHDVTATSFDTAVSIVTRYGGMAGVHSLLVTKG